MNEALPEHLPSKIENLGGEGCWLWTGWADVDGYGYVGFEGRWLRVHRVVYTLLVGPIPGGLVIDHLCRVRNCVNPAHMEPVTVRENTLRGSSLVAENARKTHCHRGHDLSDPTNLQSTSKGGRRCRTCHNLEGAEYRARRRDRAASNADAAE